MSGSTDVLFVVYIRTNHLTKSSYIFQEFTNMSKINEMKKVFEDLNLFRKDLMVRQEVSYEIKNIIYFIKDELQSSIENNISRKKKKEKLFWLNGDELKVFQYESYRKTDHKN